MQGMSECGCTIVGHSIWGKLSDTIVQDCNVVYESKMCNDVHVSIYSRTAVTNDIELRVTAAETGRSKSCMWLD